MGFNDFIETIIKLSSAKKFAEATEQVKTYVETLNTQSLIEIVKEKIVKRTIIRTDSLMNHSYEINSREDIDRYVEELKEKLIKEFEKNNNLTIR